MTPVTAANRRRQLKQLPQRMYELIRELVEADDFSEVTSIKMKLLQAQSRIAHYAADLRRYGEGKEHLTTADNNIPLQHRHIVLKEATVRRRDFIKLWEQITEGEKKLEQVEAAWMDSIDGSETEAELEMERYNLSDTLGTLRSRLSGMRPALLADAHPQDLDQPLDLDDDDPLEGL